MQPLRILTWHVHGSYLYYLAQTGQDFYLPVKPERPHGYGGRAGPFPWPPNVHEVPASEVPSLPLDCVLFQAAPHYLEDQYDLLSAQQRRLPRIYLEHDPPRQHPTDTRHLVDASDVLLVHVTPFNALMWDSGATPTRVIEHGVMVPDDARYRGELARGVVVVNHLRTRGRRLGADLFDQARQEVPLDLIGMGAEELNGVGEIDHPQLPTFMADYRFFFNPIRYTSLGLAVCEAMMVGLPVIALATTEIATVVENDVSGYVDTNPRRLIEMMCHLLADPAQAHRLGEGARRRALERFHIQRFVADWNAAFQFVTGGAAGRGAAAGLTTAGGAP